MICLGHFDGIPLGDFWRILGVQVQRVAVMEPVASRMTDYD